MWNPDAQCRSHWLLPTTPGLIPYGHLTHNPITWDPSLHLPPLGDAPTSCPAFLGSRVPQSPLAAQASTPGLIHCWMLDYPLYLPCPHTRQSRLPLCMLPKKHETLLHIIQSQAETSCGLVSGTSRYCGHHGTCHTLEYQEG